MATDYLTCGECLREFPLQCITRFIQHKKLDCDDDTDVQSQDPELKCNYCPQGFMTAWALLVHAQLTHNLKIFLEKASKSLLNQVKYSPLVKASNSDLPSLLTNCTPVIEKKICSTDGLPVKTNENSEKTVTPERDKIVDQSTAVNDSQSVTGSSSQQSKMGSNILITRNILTGSKEVGEKTDLKKVHTNFEKIITSSNVPVLQSSELNSGQKISLLPMTQTNVPLRPKLSVLPVSVSSGQIMSGSIKVIPTVLARTLPESTLPESTVKSAANTFVTVLKKEVQHGHASTDNPCLDNQKKTPENPTVLLPTSMIVSPLSSTRISKLVTNSVDLLQIPNSAGIACKVKAMDNKSVESQGKSEMNSLAQFDASVGNSLSQHEEASTQGNYMEDEEVENSAPECCDSQGCGVTVIPGSHENLQECCNAVLPKKRKRHMEQKHMPFSWSSSRYARRKMLFRSLSSSATRSTASQYMAKPSTGTIFIDLEPDSSNSGDKQVNNQEGTTFKVTQSGTPGVRILGSSSTSVPSSSVSVSHSKPHSLILKPGAVYSIPFTYTVPSSKSVATFPVPRQAISLAEPLQLSGSSSSLSSISELPTMTTLEGDQTYINAQSFLTNVNRTVEGQALQNETVRRNASSKPFQCDRCTMGFNQRIHLKKHMSKHTGIKPYKCGECNYSTVERSHLKVHIRIHTGEKPFKCTYCEYATAQNSTLKIHLKRHHGGKMFQCQTCEKQFTQEEQLKGHEWEHGTKVITSPEQKTSDIKPTAVLTSQALAIQNISSTSSQSSAAQHASSTSSQMPVLPPAAQTKKTQISPQASSTYSSPEEVKSCHTANQHQESDHMVDHLDKSANQSKDDCQDKQPPSDKAFY